jgi:hypothetical protein
MIAQKSGLLSIAIKSSNKNGPAVLRIVGESVYPALCQLVAEHTRIRSMAVMEDRHARAL